MALAGDVDVVTVADAGRVLARLRDAGSGRAVVASVLATAALLAVGWWLRAHSFEDLDVYRIGVRTWWHGGDMYGPLPPVRTGLVLPFIYPPFAALVLSPLALVSWPMSWVGMGLLSVASLVVVLFVTARRLWPEGGRGGAVLLTAVGVPVSLLLDPVAQTLWFGQVNLLLMALVAVDCVVERPRWPRGLLVGVAAAIKLTPAAFVLLFLVRRDYRAAATAGGTFAGAVLLGFAVAPASSWRYWTGSVPGLGGLAGSPFATNQAIRGALARMDTLPRVGQLALWLLLCLLMLGLAVLGMRRALRAGNIALALVVNAALALLVSPISWGHHWVYVAPALLVMTAQAVRLRSGRWAVAAVLTAIVFILHPYHFLPMADNREYGWSWWEHLVGNAYGLLTVGLLLVLAWPDIARRRNRTRATDGPYPRPVCDSPDG